MPLKSIRDRVEGADHPLDGVPRSASTFHDGGATGEALAAACKAMVGATSGRPQGHAGPAIPSPNPGRAHGRC